MNVQGADTIFSPLDVAWGLDESSYSGALRQNMVWLCGLLPFEQAAQAMKRIGRQPVSDSSLWRLVQHTQQWLAHSTEGDAGIALPEGGSAGTTQLLSMDGGMVNIFGEGWKELKVGLVGHV